MPGTAFPEFSKEEFDAMQERAFGPDRAKRIQREREVQAAMLELLTAERHALLPPIEVKPDTRYAPPFSTTVEVRGSEIDLSDAEWVR